MLLFKKKFLEQIRRGEKTQTIRLWKFRRMKAGQRSYIPGAGYIQIMAVDEVALPDLTDEDALRDGFPSANALRREVRGTLPKATGRRASRLSPDFPPHVAGRDAGHQRESRRREEEAGA